MMYLTALHIYLGTVGMRGAYSAMRNGYVDEAWARSTTAGTRTSRSARSRRSAAEPDHPWTTEPCVPSEERET